VCANFNRVLEITYKSARFLVQRIREVLRSDNLLIVSGGSIAEIDETFIPAMSPKSEKRGC